MDFSKLAVKEGTAPAELAVFQQSVRVTQQAAKINLDGITHAESLVQPQPGGNCINWVLGHLVCVYNNALLMVGEKQVVPREQLLRYDRGTPPLQDASEAVDLNELLAIFDEAAKRFDVGLGTLTERDLDAPAPISPSNDPNETVRSLLGVLSFHQAYHVGQLGTLRRLIGKKGAIA